MALAAHARAFVVGASALSLTVTACGGRSRASERGTTLPAPASRAIPSLPVAAAPVAAVVRPPPPGIVQRFGLSPFYEKYLDVDGFPVISSSRVDDDALYEAVYLVRQLTAHRPALLGAMARNRVRLVVMAVSEFTTDIPEHSDLTPKAYWDRRARGVGATQARPAVSAGEENLIELPGDPYEAENILVHELSHSLLEQGMFSLDPSFEGRVDAAFENARAKGLWAGTYAAENRSEYWAEAAQSWFDCNRVNDNQHGPVDTRDKVKAYDPMITVLLTEVFGDGPWRYVKPSRRTPPRSAHAAEERRFHWRNEAPSPTSPTSPAFSRLAWLAPAQLPRATPNRVTAPATLVFENRLDHPVSVMWVTFDGSLQKYGDVAAGGTFRQETYVGHVWAVLDRGASRGGVVATPGGGRAEIR